MKQFLLILIPATVFLAGCTLSGTPVAESPSEQKVDQNSTNQSSASSALTIKDALVSGKNAKCTYSVDNSTATMYVSGKKIRLESNGLVGEKTANPGIMINDGTTMYVWDVNTKIGFKANLEEMKQTTEDAQSNLGNNKTIDEWKDPETWAADTQNKYQVSCEPSTTTDSQFVPPTDVRFQDMNQMMKTVNQYMKDKPSDLNNLPQTPKDINDIPLPNDNPVNAGDDSTPQE